APAPCDAGATTVAAGRGSPNLVPRSAGSDLPAASAESVAHPVDPSSACVRAECESRLRLRSATQTPVRPQAVRTSERVRWLPCPRVPSGRLEHGRTSPPPRDALAAFPGTLRSRYLPKLFVETGDGNLLL